MPCYLQSIEPSNMVHLSNKIKLATTARHRLLNLLINTLSNGPNNRPDINGDDKDDNNFIWNEDSGWQKKHIGNSRTKPAFSQLAFY